MFSASRVAKLTPVSQNIRPAAVEQRFRDTKILQRELLGSVSGRPHAIPVDARRPAVERSWRRKSPSDPCTGPFWRAERGLRRAFTPEFKAEVVELCRRGDRSIGQVARDLDPTETAVREGVRRADVDPGRRDGLTTGLAYPGAGAPGDLLVHRGLLQPPEAALEPRLSQPSRVRGPRERARGNGRCRIINVSVESGEAQGKLRRPSVRVRPSNSDSVFQFHLVFT